MLTYTYVMLSFLYFLQSTLLQGCYTLQLLQLCRMCSSNFGFTNKVFELLNFFLAVFILNQFSKKHLGNCYLSTIQASPTKFHFKPDKTKLIITHHSSNLAASKFLHYNLTIFYFNLGTRQVFFIGTL